MSQVTVSVIIPTLNSARTIESCLTAIKKNGSKYEYEIIIVDAGSTDHMIDEQDYEAFVWIKENIGEGYEKAILDPWKATAFTAITGKKVYGRIQRYPLERAERATEFLDENCQDTEFLRENEITIVYSLFVCDNPDLIKLRRHIYILKD